MTENQASTPVALRHIRKVLLAWDPIGIAELADAQDEYDAYLKEIQDLLQSQDPRQKLVAFLWWLQTVHMGLSGQLAETEAIADRLLRLNSIDPGNKPAEAD